MQVVLDNTIVGQVASAISDAAEAGTPIKHIALTEAEMRDFLRNPIVKMAEGVDLVGPISQIETSHGTPEGIADSFLYMQTKIIRIKP